MTYIQIGNRTVPIYSLIAVIGVIISIGIIYFLCRKTKNDFQDTVTFYILSFAGGLVGSKIMFLVVSRRDIMNDMDAILKDFSFFFNKYIFGGLVFYGALIGAIITALIYCRVEKVKFTEIALPVVTVIPFVHGVARIGCHIVGCCYGVPTDLPIGIVYENSIAAPAGVALMPVQLMESGCNFIIFIVLLLLFRKRDTFLSLGVYMCAYAVIRFLLEFLRGDDARGFVGVLSTSQLISILILAGGVFLLIKRKKKISAQ